MFRTVAVEVPRDVAAHLLEQLEAKARLPISISWDDENELLGALKVALEGDDVEDEC